MQACSLAVHSQLAGASLVSLEAQLANLKPRERLLLDAKLAGHSMAECAEIAHYSGPESARQALYHLRNRLPGILERAGITVERIAKKISDLLDDPDHRIQLDTAKFSAKLIGIDTDKQEVSVVHDIADRLIEGRKRVAQMRQLTDGNSASDAA
jgi:hypothetical protein